MPISARLVEPSRDAERRDIDRLHAAINEHAEAHQGLAVDGLSGGVMPGHVGIEACWWPKCATGLSGNSV